VAVQEKSALLKKAQPTIAEQPVPTIATKEVHIHITPEEDDKAAPATDQRGLIASFAILLMSIPALIGA